MAHQTPDARVDSSVAAASAALRFDGDLRASALPAIGLLQLVIGFAVGVLYLASDALPVAIVSMTGGALGALVWGLSRGERRIASGSALLVSGDAVLVAIACYFGGGVGGFAVCWFAFVPAFAGALGDAKLAVASCVAIAVFIGLLLALDRFGLVPPSTLAPARAIAVMSATLPFLAALLLVGAYAHNREQRRIVQRVMRTIADLQESRASLSQLTGLVTVCMECKSVQVDAQDDQVWASIDDVLQRTMQTRYEPTLCPSCAPEAQP